VLNYIVFQVGRVSLVLGWASAMTTLVTFLGALIVSGVILYAAYTFMRFAVHCFLWAVRSAGRHAPKHGGRPHLRYRERIH
jgi:hypothetical protein